MADEPRMNFYRTFYDLTTLLPERERQKVNTALLDFFFEGIEPTGLSASGMKVFNGCKGRVSKSRTNAANVSSKCADSNPTKGATNALTKDPTKPLTKEPTKDPTKPPTKGATNALTKDPTKPPPEREREREREKELEKEMGSTPPYVEIVSALNVAAGTAYKPTSRKTRQLIDARWHEGFTLDDFLTVIDTMSAEWGNEPKMSAYLRPETLFGTKFESYLNRPKKTRKEDRYAAYE